MSASLFGRRRQAPGTADGVAFGWDRSESLECISMHLPGLEGAESKLRIPIVAVEQKYCIKHKTFDDMCEVIRQSFVCLYTGRHMQSRFDGKEWTPKDHKKEEVEKSMGKLRFM